MNNFTFGILVLGIVAVCFAFLLLFLANTIPEFFEKRRQAKMPLPERVERQRLLHIWEQPCNHCLATLALQDDVAELRKAIAKMKTSNDRADHLYRIAYPQDGDNNG